MLINTTEAAERLKLHRSRIIALIRSGRLPAQKIGRDWLILAKDLKLVKIRKPGNPNFRKIKS